MLSSFFSDFKENQARCLAVYGPPQTYVNFSGFYDTLLDYMRKNAFEPSAMAISGKEKYHDGKIRPFAQYKTTITREKFAGVSSLTLWGSRKNVNIFAEKEYKDIEAGMSSNGCKCYIYERVTSEDLTLEWARDLAAKVLSFYGAVYGIAYTIPYRFAPDLYTEGFVTNIEQYPSQAEIERISKWAHFMMEVRTSGVFPKNCLREVKQFNLLSPEHIDMLVGSVSLNSWIIMSRNRGRIESFRDDFYIWVVPVKSLDMINEELGARGLLVSYGDFQTPSGGPIGDSYAPGV